MNGIRQWMHFNKEETLDARLNAEADHYATAAQKHQNSITLASVPTFFMNDFTPCREVDGWIESNVREITDKIMVKQIKQEVSIGHQHRMKTGLYHRASVPQYSYHRATSAYTATLQLYARSGQLPTAAIMKEREDVSVASGRCRLGCREREDEMYILSVCPQFHKWREEAGKELADAINTRFTAQDISDDEMWPLGYSTYYLGHVPNLKKLAPAIFKGEALATKRLMNAIYCEWHNIATRLSARIFGEMQRRVAKHWEERGGGN